LSADGISNPTDVDIYHISDFTPVKGDGSEILRSLCKAADEYGGHLCIQAEAQFNGKQTMTTPELIGWHHRFGFTGNRMMHREPVSQ
jgi:hypothetical protein